MTHRQKTTFTTTPPAARGFLSLETLLTLSPLHPIDKKRRESRRREPTRAHRCRRALSRFVRGVRDGDPIFDRMKITNKIEAFCVSTASSAVRKYGECHLKSLRTQTTAVIVCLFSDVIQVQRNSPHRLKTHFGKALIHKTRPNFVHKHAPGDFDRLNCLELCKFENIFQHFPYCGNLSAKPHKNLTVGQGISEN